ncbi:hypothetical protein BIW11_12243 [Tropilaelaps mercedesae]|uniref:N-acetyltransferase domain-containing protein n=1 Tax=Tropilaelaps mercedesae TaxID=418985 RepID=A0A1V9X789_9ACAR|nr:hypothetical protein BIW11_12243 [Tropilaelaps mercedesae]
MTTSLADQIVVRPLRTDEVRYAVEIWKEQNLEEGMHTLQLWHMTDPEGFIGAVDKDTGEVVGSCAAIRQKEGLYFVGLYAVRTELQGRGIGMKMWDYAMKRVGDSNAGLNAIPKHLSTYRDRAGFSHVAPWNTWVYASPWKDITLNKLVPVKDYSIILRRVYPGDDETLGLLVDYDEKVHNFCRERVIRTTMDDEDGILMVALKGADNAVAGFGKISTNIQGGALVGPLYADDIVVARRILRSLVSDFAPSTVTVTAFAMDGNPDSCRLCEELGLQRLMAVPRCYREAGVPQADFGKVFAHHTLNFSLF